MSEPAFFHLAYRLRYGSPATDQDIEPYFMGYLLARRVPFWTQRLAREIVERSRREEVRPTDYGIEPVATRSVPPATRGRFPHVVLGLIYGACVLLVAYHAF
ncbi:MAG: hypothetical protein ACREH6_07335 [Geminicoccaceae bacterium]